MPNPTNSIASITQGVVPSHRSNSQPISALPSGSRSGRRGSASPGTWPTFGIRPVVLPVRTASSTCACFNRSSSDVSRASSGRRGSCPGSFSAMPFSHECSRALGRCTGRGTCRRTNPPRRGSFRKRPGQVNSAAAVQQCQWVGDHAGVAHRPEPSPSTGRAFSDKSTRTAHPQWLGQRDRLAAVAAAPDAVGQAVILARADPAAEQSRRRSPRRPPRSSRRAGRRAGCKRRGAGC